MTITTQQAEAILEPTRRALSALRDLWDAQRDIENTLGQDFRSMTDTMSYYVTDAGEITVEDVQHLIEQLDEEGQ